jgi:hypothetical protein
MVLEGGADLGVTTAASERPALHFTEIGPDRFVALLPSGHELASEPQVRWRDVARSPFIALTELSSIRRVTEAAFIAAGVAPRILCEVEQISSCVALVEAGPSVTALPTSAIPMVRGHDVSVRPSIGPVTRRGSASPGSLTRPYRRPNILWLIYSRTAYDRCSGAVHSLSAPRRGVRPPSSSTPRPPRLAQTGYGTRPLRCCPTRHCLPPATRLFNGPSRSNTRAASTGSSADETPPVLRPAKLGPVATFSVPTIPLMSA